MRFSINARKSDKYGHQPYLSRERCEGSTAQTTGLSAISCWRIIRGAIITKGRRITEASRSAVRTPRNLDDADPRIDDNDVDNGGIVVADDDDGNCYPPPAATPPSLSNSDRLAAAVAAAHRLAHSSSAPQPQPQPPPRLPRWRQTRGGRSLFNCPASPVLWTSPCAESDRTSRCHPRLPTRWANLRRLCRRIASGGRR